MTEKLAIFNGDPIRSSPYPTHTTIVDDEEKKAIIEVLKSEQE